MKFIVFAHHLDMLNSLENFAKKKNYEYMRIDGSTNVERDYEY